MRQDSLDQVAALLGSRAGLAITATMRLRLDRTLGRAADSAGIAVDEYASRVASDHASLQRLIEDLTVQESSFFRDPAQFDALARYVLPQLRPPVRIWSSGCSRGQEPYSLAMLLQEAGYSDALVVGTDISADALAYAEAGRYPQSTLRGLSPQRRDAWMDRGGDRWAVRESLRRQVSFARHNIATDAPPFLPGQCQVIFCRNVLIYFRQDAQMTALERMRAWLPPGGMLFLGYSESLWQVTDIFEPVRLGDAFAYRKPGAASPPMPPPPPPPPATVSSAPAGSDSLPRVAELLRKGEIAMAGDDLTEAVAAFRQAAYLDHAHPVAHFHLGLALEAKGETVAANRAYRGARAALRLLDPASTPPELLGYRTDALVRLLDIKLAADET